MKSGGTRPTTAWDGPKLGDSFFTGTRQKFIAEFEVCAYCYNSDGTIGQVLGCMTWRFERTKGGGTGDVSVPNQRSGPPSTSHQQAVDLFVRRHTRREGDRFVKLCPDARSDLLEQAEGLNRQLMEETNEAAKQELREQIMRLIRRAREARGREP